MTKSKKSALLTVMSILVIIIGIAEIAVGLIGAVTGSALTYIGAATGFGALVGIGIVIVVISLVGGVLELAAGICSARRRALGFCTAIAVICIILSGVLFGLSLYYGASSFLIGVGVIALAFNVLYLIGIVQVRRRTS